MTNSAKGIIRLSRFIPTRWRAFLRHLPFVAIPLTGLLVMLALGGDPKILYHFLPIVLVFALWRRVATLEKPIFLRFSLYGFLLSAGAFVWAWVLRDSHPERQMALLAFATASGLFAMTPFWTYLRFSIKHPRLTLISVYSAFSVYIYHLLLLPFWHHMYYVTGMWSYLVLCLLGYSDAQIGFIDPHLVSIKGMAFGIIIFKGCSGFEGITLFLLMLSCMFMLDWGRFKKAHLLKYYLYGALFIFFANALRIALIFMLGDWAYDPHSIGFAHYFQGVPIMLFHNYIGWTFYLIAFWVFSGYVQRDHPPERASLSRG